MKNPETPIGENGRKEIKLTKVEEKEASKLLDKFFEGLESEGKKIDFRALAFDVPKVVLKANDRPTAENVNLNEVMNVSENARREFKYSEMMNGLRASAKNADPAKVKETVRKLKEQKAKKQNSAEKVEKPNEDREDR